MWDKKKIVATNEDVYDIAIRNSSWHKFQIITIQRARYTQEKARAQEPTHTKTMKIITVKTTKKITIFQSFSSLLLYKISRYILSDKHRNIIYLVNGVLCLFFR